MEPEIAGIEGTYELAMEKEYMINYLAHTILVILDIKAKIEDYKLTGESTEKLEHLLENTYVIKDGLEMSIQDITWQEANL